MKRINIITTLALVGATGTWLLHATETTEPVPVYNEHRSFALPVRPNPVGPEINVDRAFWGAPPPMPHSFTSAKDDGNFCLTCHALERRIKQRHQAIAPVPHAEFSQCQQCHVPKGDGKSLFRESLFVGLDFPGKGTRAHDYAPPTIPHKTFMRNNCQSCHGPSGKQKISSPHPYRSQCQQCHVSDASKNYDRPLSWGDLNGQM